MALAANRLRVAEVEFVFRMRRPLTPRSTPYTSDEVMASIAALHLGVEIPDSRYLDFVSASAAHCRSRLRASIRPRSRGHCGLARPRPLRLRGTGPHLGGRHPRWRRRQCSRRSAHRADLARQRAQRPRRDARRGPARHDGSLCRAIANRPRGRRHRGLRPLRNHASAFRGVNASRCANARRSSAGALRLPACRAFARSRGRPAADELKGPGRAGRRDGDPHDLVRAFQDLVHAQVAEAPGMFLGYSGSLRATGAPGRTHPCRRPSRYAWPSRSRARRSCFSQ